MSCGVSNASEIDELSFVKELHLRTVQKLGLDRSVLFNSGSSSPLTEFRRDLLVFGGRDQQRREILLHSAQIEVCSGGHSSLVSESFLCVQIWRRRRRLRSRRRSTSFSVL